MYVDTTSFLNSARTVTQEAASSDLDKDAFLTLFMAKLENQDPLNPMDDTETISQLAQFSSLEQLTNISTAMDDLSSLIQGQQQVSAVSYLGKTVMAEGDQVALTDGKATDMTYTLGADAKEVTVSIFDANGNIVRTLELGSLKSGEQDFSWDGKDYNGNTLKDGTYEVAISGVTADGEAVSVSQSVEGKVTGVSTVNGSVSLTLSDGRTVALSGVGKVTG